MKQLKLNIVYEISNLNENGEPVETRLNTKNLSIIEDKERALKFINDKMNKLNVATFDENKQMVSKLTGLKFDDNKIISNVGFGIEEWKGRLIIKTYF